MSMNRIVITLMAGCAAAVFAAAPGFAAPAAQEHKHPAVDQAKPATGDMKPVDGRQAALIDSGRLQSLSD